MSGGPWEDACRMLFVPVAKTEHQELMEERQQSARLCEEKGVMIEALRVANTALIDSPCFCVADDSPPCKRCVALAKINKLL